MNARFPKAPAIWAIVMIASVLLAACGATIEDARAACQGQAVGTTVVVNDVPVNCTADLVAETARDVTTTPIALPTSGSTTSSGPVAQPGGVTDCATMEKTLSGDGTEANPIVYPITWLHDLCFAWTSGGTGAKYVEVPGPAALQMGEATGPHRMVFVPAGTTFTGWTQGGWRYTTDTALLAQWMIEDATTGRLGLICGYVKDTKLAAPAYKWDGSQEVRDTSLDCPYSVTALLSADDSTTTTGYGYEAYLEIFKVEVSGTFYCGARAADAEFPNGTRQIETWPKGESDGDYLLDGGSNGMSTTKGFCKGLAENGKPWTTVLLTADGYEEVTFPLK